MLSLTLDTNCILALDALKNDPSSPRKAEAELVQKIVDAHLRQEARVAVVAISASERQSGKTYLESFSDFEKRLASLNLEQLHVLNPMAYFDITFFDNCLFCDEEMEELERKIHLTLFPAIQFDWQEYCAANGISETPETPDGRWRNAKCDVQAFWSHVWHKQDVFVTSDQNFQTQSKKEQLLLLAGGHIATPSSAVALIGNERGAA
jgi:hypothetical protein